MASLQEVASVIRHIASTDMAEGELATAVRERFPEATRSEIVRGSLLVLLEGLNDEDLAKKLHDFAMTERAAARRN